MVEGLGSEIVSGPESGQARYPAAAVTGCNLEASGPPGRAAGGQAWSWR